MNKDQATPRPWEVKIDDANNPNTFIFSMNGKYAIVETMGDDYSNAEANAKLIVKACNNYDIMIELLKEIIKKGEINDSIRERAIEIFKQDSNN